MKLKLFLYIITFFVIVSLPTACNKDIVMLEHLVPLEPIDSDANARTWTPILLTSNDQILVPVPEDINSVAYKTELETIKNVQANLNEEQKRAIEYWSGGGVLRWNQIMRELVARFNLPPAPNAEGNYPVPDPENPFGDPMFPFSNPPYAARAYSYVSAAQYDALKAAWYYKYTYNRLSPFQNDPTIKALVPESNLPAYPSEDAVMSGVMAEMLKMFFPAAVEEITLKAAEQRNVALWSGKAASSDVAAGLALGKSVAELFKEKAATDGMKNSTGNKIIWKSYEDIALNIGEIPWSCLESPVRPPMLMAFGQVKAWMLSPEDIVMERPLPPPSTSSAKMKEELEEVLHYTKNATREQIAIVHKWADGVGTYTPPGHWNDIAAEFIRDARFSEVRASRAFALLNIALHDAAVGCWETKFHYFNPRPCQLNPEIKTTAGVPNFPAFTSGHSTFSAAAATVLSYLFPQNSEYFHQQANEAALSRLYGGIHFRSDVEMGTEHGFAIGNYTIRFAQEDNAK
ncbi:MAG: phosphatase PAP2 family protein [Bacteroidota bacterium]|nr:phosphatase PAP2 family protein [Bacteroidota bacterium]